MSLSRRKLINISASAALLLPLSGVASSNGKKTSSKDKLDIFVIYGQSNALGFAGLDEGFKEDDLVKIIGGSYYYFLGEIRPLVHYIPSVNSGVSSGSAWSQFSNTYKQMTGRSCLFIQCSRGSTHIELLSPPSNNYKRMVAATKDAISILGKNASGRVYCLFHQGEADQLLETDKERYKELLLSIGHGMKNDLSLNKFFLFKVASPTRRKEEYITAIQSAQEEVCKSDDLFVMAFSGCPSFNHENLLLGSDGTHYSIFGYNVMGQVSAENVAENINTITTITNDEIKKYGALSLNPRYEWKMIAASFIIIDDEFRILTNSYPERNSGMYSTSNVIKYKLSDDSIIIKPAFYIEKILSASASFKSNEKSISASLSVDVIKGGNIFINCICNISFDIKVGDNNIYKPFSDEVFNGISEIIKLCSVGESNEIIIEHPPTGMNPNVLIRDTGRYDMSLGYRIKTVNNKKISIKPYVSSVGDRIGITLLNCELPFGKLKLIDSIVSFQVIAA